MANQQPTKRARKKAVAPSRKKLAVQSVASTRRKSTAKASKPVASVREPGVPLQKKAARDTRKPVAGKRRKSATIAARPPSLHRPVLASGRSGAPEIMVTLDNEHRYIASLLEALAEQADNLLPGRSPDYGMIHDIVHYMASYPDQYHHPREDLVFDRLLERDAESRDVVEQLLEGHREVSRLSRELLDELSRVTSGDHPADKQKIKFLCDRYIGYNWDHMNMEEGKLFPRATAKLRQDDWFAVNAEARYVDDPLFGTRVRKEYQRLSGYLSQRAERIAEDVAIAELFGIEALIETVAVLSSAVGEIQDVVDARLRQSFSALRRRVSAEERGNLLGRPRAIGATIVEQARSGAADIGEIAKRTRRELSEPFATRLK